MKLRIGTRASKLALAQAKAAAQIIEESQPQIQTELVPITTTGDKILDKTLDKVGGKGLFVRELDAALLDDRIDIAVHSCKDVPMDVDSEIPLVAASRRADPRDVLVLPLGVDKRDESLPIGSSSARRRVQLARLFPNTEVKSVRGNVLTRLEKLDNKEFGALVLAAAGLERLGLSERVSMFFSVDEMLPSAGQAIIAIQARRDFDTSCLEAFNDENSFTCMLAERAFTRALDGGCSKPCAAHATIEDDGLLLRGLYVSDDESELRYGQVHLSKNEIESGAEALAKELKNNG